MDKNSPLRQLISLTVIVAVLGYFINIYDLLLFGIAQVSSLIALNMRDDCILKDGINFINVQMARLLIGGILSGIFKKRLY